MLKRKALAVAGVGILALVSVNAQQKSIAPSPKAVTLGVTDYLEIQQLVTRYAFAVDSTLADNGYMYAGLFAPDGALSNGTVRRSLDVSR